MSHLTRFQPIVARLVSFLASLHLDALAYGGAWGVAVLFLGPDGIDDEAGIVL